MNTKMIFLTLGVLMLTAFALFGSGCAVTPKVSASTNTNSFTIADTGQTKCYNNSAEISCPSAGQAFYGQDAQMQGSTPSYRDNGDGTITDLNTGLMWVKASGSKVTYTQAVAGASTSRVGGYSDWRVPTIQELYSLILFSGTDVSPCMNGSTCSSAVPFIDTNYFEFQYGNTSAGERLIDAQYWSSTPYVSTTMGGAATQFGVNFADGRIKGYPRSTSLNGSTMTEFVRYVRGGSNYGVNQFVNNSDGTITDNATALMWTQSDSGAGMNWQSALAWVQSKNAENYLGHNDWRLPNAKELQSIVDYTRSPDTTQSAAINAMFNVTTITNEGGQTDYPSYWTNTTHAASNGGGDWAVYIAFGRALGYMQTPMGTQLMDVHGAGAQRSDPKSGSASDYPNGHGPQGDVVRVNNYVRLVRDVSVSNITPTATTIASATATSTVAATATPTVAATATTVTNLYNMRPPDGAVVRVPQPLLKWDAVQNTVRYEIQIRAKSASGTLIANTQTNKTEFRTPPLKNLTAYYWRIRACAPAKCQAWSPYQSFTFRAP